MDTPVVEAHRHGFALVRPLLRALTLALAGALCLWAPWTVTAAIGAVLLTLAAAVAFVAVARWERTHLSVTETALVIEHGFLSRRTASISLNGTVFEVERTMLGRMLGYGTVVAGELEIDWVPRRITRRLQKRK